MIAASQERLDGANCSTGSKANGGGKLEEDSSDEDMDRKRVDVRGNRYPFCLVWTPIPMLSWLLPMIGHMGICTSSGVIRDFAGPYFVGQGKMAFGKPTRYLQLDPALASGGVSGWDRGVAEASDIYSQRIHNLFCDNCHSHVAMALDLMCYDGSHNWNMFLLCFIMFFRAKFVGTAGFLKTFLPWLILMSIVLILVLVTTLL